MPEYRFDINGDWKPFTPIKPHFLHTDMLYIPSLIEQLYKNLDDLTQSYNDDLFELRQSFFQDDAYLAKSFHDQRCEILDRLYSLNSTAEIIAPPNP